jgi:hypothetical protein
MCSGPPYRMCDTGLSEQAKHRFGIEISVRVGVHRGLVYCPRTTCTGWAANRVDRDLVRGAFGGLSRIDG